MLNGFTDSYRIIRVVNKSDAIRDTECYGCDFCEVLINRKYRIEQERYYCNAKRMKVKPHEVCNCERRCIE